MKIRIDDDYESNDFDKFRIVVEDGDNDVVKSGVRVIKDEVTVVEAGYKEVNDVCDAEYEEYYNQFVKEDDNIQGDINGRIIVYSRLASKSGTLISSAQINLYLLNGLSPQFVDTQYSNSEGVVVFDNLSQGSYRIIAIVDRKYFEKPTYVDWNEVTINSDTLEAEVTVVNKIKTNFKK